MIASGTLAVELNIKTRLPGYLTRFESQLTLKRISNETPRYPHSLSFPAATNSLFMCPSPGRLTARNVSKSGEKHHDGLRSYLRTVKSVGLVQQVSSELARSLVHLGRALPAVQRQRRAIRELRALDQRMLADIGLGYGEIESAVRRGRSGENPLRGTCK